MKEHFMPNETTKRIAKNTAMLYLRMLLTMAVSLYTSRIVLNTLGVEDFGIYNVVGGVVIIFSFLNAAMAVGTQRFLSYELGNSNFDRLKKIFSTTLNIHFLIGVVVLILAETVGLWFLNLKMNIPSERMEAANYIYQFSIMSFFVSVLQVPYNACIIAHERMNIYAYVSIFEVLFKLLVAFLITWTSYDKLKVYSILLFIVIFMVAVVYKSYCKKQFHECTYSFLWDRVLFKTLLNYAGWNFFGNLAYVGYTQGLNILLNIFFGPAINAARGISVQVQSAIFSFVSNFQLAVSPQIVKSYAAGEHQYMKSLVYNSSRYSFFMLFFLALPILLKTEYLLKVWLIKLPDNAVFFTRLMIINSLIDVFANPLGYAMQATGKIETFQIVIGGILLLNLPISYLFLTLGYGPDIVFYVSIILTCVAVFSRLAILTKFLNLSKMQYFSQVISRVLIVTVIASILPVMSLVFIGNTFKNFAMTTIISFVSGSTTIFFMGLNRAERLVVVNKIKSFAL